MKGTKKRNNKDRRGEQGREREKRKKDEGKRLRDEGR